LRGRGGLERGPSLPSRFPVREIWEAKRSIFRFKLLISLGERGGTRTLDPMIKRQVLSSAVGAGAAQNNRFASKSLFSRTFEVRLWISGIVRLPPSAPFGPPSPSASQAMSISPDAVERWPKWALAEGDKADGRALSLWAVDGVAQDEEPGERGGAPGARGRVALRQ
jgi:hypothetical protein